MIKYKFSSAYLKVVLFSFKDIETAWRLSKGHFGPQAIYCTLPFVFAFSCFHKEVLCYNKCIFLQEFISKWYKINSREKLTWISILFFFSLGIYAKFQKRLNIFCFLHLILVKKEENIKLNLIFLKISLSTAFQTAHVRLAAVRSVAGLKKRAAWRQNSFKSIHTIKQFLNVQYILQIAQVGILCP